jgi:ABC-type phosphate transport system substrate-binding protein
MMRSTFCILVLLALAPVGARGQVAVIANQSVPATALDEERLMDLYTGEIKMWRDGVVVVLADLKPKTDVKKLFYDYLGMRPSRMKSIWLKNMLAGEGDPPQAFETEDALLEHVASTPGAIGYVSLAKARAAEGVVTLLEIPLEDD